MLVLLRFTQSHHNGRFISFDSFGYFNKLKWKYSSSIHFRIYYANKHRSYTFPWFILAVLSSTVLLSLNRALLFSFRPERLSTITLWKHLRVLDLCHSITLNLLPSLIRLRILLSHCKVAGNNYRNDTHLHSGYTTVSHGQ